MATDATVITNNNIKTFIRDYLTNKTKLPGDLRDKLIGQWDVHQVTDMSILFSGFPNFNEDLNTWYVRNVTDMTAMFSSCKIFNKPLNNWDVRNVKHMGMMFSGCAMFDQDLNTWDVRNVTYMTAMFSSCKIFNKPLNNWDVRNVTHMGMMFSGCAMFDQDLNTNQELNTWNVSNVTNMKGMFSNCKMFNKPLNNWNVSNVTNMEMMFHGCERFDQDLNTWDVRNVTNITNMFQNCPIAQANKPMLPVQIQRQIPAAPAAVVDPRQIHRESAKIDLDLLIQVLTPLVNPINPIQASQFAGYIDRTINSIIGTCDAVSEVNSEHPVSKDKFRSQFQTLNSQRLQRLDYDQFNPTLLLAIQYILSFVQSQSPKFQTDYLTMFLNDCLTAYGDTQISCAAGILERFVTLLRDTCVMAQGYNGSTPEQVEIYNKIIEAINSDPNIFIPMLILDWMKSRNIAKNEAKPESEKVKLDIEGKSVEERRNMLRTYLIGYFPSEPKLIDDQVDAVDLGDADFTYGGQRRRKTRRGKKRKTQKSKKNTRKRKQNKTKNSKRM